MKILVFDDNPVHRAAAEAQLKSHDLTVVGTYDEARDLLTPQYDWKKADALMTAQFGDYYPKGREDDERARAYRAAKKAAREEATTRHSFEVILTDLLVPASTKSQGPSCQHRSGEEMPIGIFIGLLAALKGAARYVAVFTDSDHHRHAASACFDVFNDTSGEHEPNVHFIGWSKFMLSNTRNWVNQFNPGDLSKALEYEEYKDRKDTVQAKNWATVLEYLLNA